MRNLAAAIGLLCLLDAPLAIASDFDETQQAFRDSGRHASMQGDRLPQDPGVRSLVVAGTAYIDCMRADRAKRDAPADEVVKTCASSRATYAALLPRENAAFELGLLDASLMPQPAGTEP